MRSLLCSLVLASVLLAGCKGDPCTDIGGTWEVTSHCDASVVGAQMHLVAVGDRTYCMNRIQDGPFAGVYVAVNAAGQTSVTPEFDGGTLDISCEGTTQGGTMVLDCTRPTTCHVELRRVP